MRSQGWTGFILDTNGNGRRDAYVEADQPLDPTKDKRINVGFYGVSPAADGSVWGSVLGFPGAVVRLNPGPNPTETALAEYYEVPFDNPGASTKGAFSPRGFDVDRNGVAWLALASGHMASFDRQQAFLPGRAAPVLPRAGFTSGSLPQLGWTDSGRPRPRSVVDCSTTLGLATRQSRHRQRLEGPRPLKDGKWVVMRVP